MNCTCYATLSKYGKKISRIRVNSASGLVGPGQLGRVNSACYIWYMGIWLLVGNFILLIVPMRYFSCGSVCFRFWSRIFVLFEPYVRFRLFILVPVTEWPPIGK